MYDARWPCSAEETPDIYPVDSTIIWCCCTYSNRASPSLARLFVEVKYLVHGGNIEGNGQAVVPRKGEQHNT